MLDTASLIVSTIDIETNPQVQITIRSGFLALRRLAEFFHLPFDPDPAPDAPISIHREEYDALVEQLREAGLPIRADLDLAWQRLRRLAGQLRHAAAGLVRTDRRARRRRGHRTASSTWARRAVRLGTPDR